MTTVEKFDGAVAQPARPHPSRAAVAVDDLRDGFRRRWIWSALAWQDVRARYRGSILGPFWLTVATLIMVASMGVLYSHLLNTKLDFYIPFLTTGLVLWQLVNTTITESCETFSANRGVILQIPMPFSIYAYRLALRNLIVLGHNLLIVPFVLLLFHSPLNWHLLLFIPGLALVSLNAVWVALLLGMICTRFLDIKPIVQSFLQVVFFITPIFWAPSALGRWETLAELNPLFAAVDITRSPLLGVATAPYSWTVALATLVVGSALSFVLFARFRARIAYWI
jgi:ABC-2 type transport system permease protein/lipopolysaccharide transport system permease protein